MIIQNGLQYQWNFSYSNTYALHNRSLRFFCLSSTEMLIQELIVTRSNQRMTTPTQIEIWGSED